MGTETGLRAAAAAKAEPAEGGLASPGRRRGAPGDSGGAGAHSMGTGSEPGTGADVAVGGAGGRPLGRLFMMLRRCRLHVFAREKPLRPRWAPPDCGQFALARADLLERNELRVWERVPRKNVRACGLAAKVLAPTPSMPCQLCASHYQGGKLTNAACQLIETGLISNQRFDLLVSI